MRQSRNRPQPSDESLSEAEQFDRAMQRALRSLGQRARTETELLRTLAARGTTEEVAQRVVERCRELGYLNDAALASDLAQSPSSRTMGTRLLSNKLRARGVDEADAAAALAEFGDRDAEQARADAVAADAAERARRNGQPLDQVWRRRTGGKLARRGFSTEVVMAALRRAERDES